MNTKTRIRSVHKAAVRQRRHALALAVLKALQPVNGRSHRCKMDELPERLEQDSITITPAELSDVLARLEDVSQIIRAQRNAGYPMYVVPCGDHPFDDVDALAADICTAMKARDERFDDEDQLTAWLDEDGVSYSSHCLAVALRQLEHLGRINRPVQEFGLPTPGIYVSPRIFTGILP